MIEPDQPNTALAHSYPPPPWTLAGSFLNASFALRAKAVAALVPEPLKLVTLPGGLALGSVTIGRYGPGSTLEYNELIAAVAVRYGRRPGIYVTHIGVDNNASLRGGRELWNLPKQLWRFEWEFDPLRISLRVWDGVNLVCAISEVSHSARLWPLRGPLTTFTVRNGIVAVIPSEGDMRCNRTPWRWQPGPDSPLALFQPAGPMLTTVARGRMYVQPLR
jgi:hypothetical protein